MTMPCEMYAPLLIAVPAGNDADLIFDGDVFYRKGVFVIELLRRQMLRLSPTVPHPYKLTDPEGEKDSFLYPLVHLPA